MNMMNKIIDDFIFSANNFPYRENKTLLFRIILKIEQNLIFMDNLSLLSIFC